jgi:hypothetical protein
MMVRGVFDWMILVFGWCLVITIHINLATMVLIVDSVSLEPSLVSPKIQYAFITRVRAEKDKNNTEI